MYNNVNKYFRETGTLVFRSPSVNIFFIKCINFIYGNVQCILFRHKKIIIFRIPVLKENQLLEIG